MLADLDLLLTVVYCMADDFLPKPPGNARRKITDAEIVTLCVAQAIMGIPSDYRFVAVAGKRLRHLFPAIPTRDALHKRRMQALGPDRGADRAFRAPEPRVLRRSAAGRLHPG